MHSMDIFHSNRLIFVTGSAGSGKSSNVRRFLKDQDVTFLTTSPFHAMATNSLEIKNFLGVGDCFNDKNHYCHLTLKFLGSDDAFVIEEVSRLSEKVFEIFNMILTNSFDKTKSFGGKKIVLIGDLKQNPIEDLFVLPNDFATIDFDVRCNESRSPGPGPGPSPRYISSSVIKSLPSVDFLHRSKIPKILNIFWDENTRKFSRRSGKPVYTDDWVICEKQLYAIVELNGDLVTLKGDAGASPLSASLENLIYFPLFVMINETIISPSNKKMWLVEKVEERDPMINFLCRHVSVPFCSWVGQQVISISNDTCGFGVLGIITEINDNSIDVLFDFHRPHRFERVQMQIQLTILYVHKNGRFTRDCDESESEIVGRIKLMPLISGHNLKSSLVTGLIFDGVLVNSLDDQTASTELIFDGTPVNSSDEQILSPESSFQKSRGRSSLIVSENGRLW